MYIGSADLMTRNINKRIEIACPVLDQDVKAEINHLMDNIFSDNVKARRLLSDGRYHKVQSLSAPFDSQEECLKEAQGRNLSL